MQKIHAKIGAVKEAVPLEFDSKRRSAIARRALYIRRYRLTLKGEFVMMSLMSARPVADPRYDAVVARDAAWDGRFVYGVATTGVYCNPSCAARTPKAQNVRFYADCDSAEAAGFRPCKRCRPRDGGRGARMARMIADICREIEGAEEAPLLDDLAARAGLSAWHFHRVFKAQTGVTPKAYAAAHRARRVRENLRDGASSVTSALYDAGFNSNGRFYAASDGILGMTPKRFQKGGAGTDIRFAVAQSKLGAILVAESDRGICAISLGDDPDGLVRELQDRFPKARLVGDDTGFDARVAQVVALVEQPKQGLDLPLDIRGTAFQQRVWQALRAIPAGQTLSYTELAERVGAPKAVRAVAGACAANTLAVAVPCHRIVRIDGGLSGYRWGVERKRALLDAESPEAGCS
jgi:AraC family transcriptional regulator of adaptative response/methylated-DNA-[protein]-cysteine methyltransferase